MQEMGLTDVDLAYIGVKNAAQRKALKMAAGGFVELMLQVDISGFFNYNSELVRRRRERGNTLLSLSAKRVNLDLADLLLLLCCSMFVCFALPRLFHALFCC